MAASARAASRPTDEHVQRVTSVAFDAAFYRAAHDDLPPDMDAFWHYRRQGWREGRDPAPWFSAKDYLDANADVKRRRVDPLYHYLTLGRFEGRDVAPSRHARAYFDAIAWSPTPWSYPDFATAPDGVRPGLVGVAMSKAESDAAVASGFDASYYLASNPDVAASGMDPMAHFVATGWLEDRDPNPAFSVRDYLDANPDVAAAGLNPFAHYQVAGRAEGRAPRHDLGFEFDVIARLRPIGDRIAASVTASGALTVDPAERLTAGLVSLKHDLHITFSHDNYTQSAGGLQFCVRHEGDLLVRMGRDHLHLFPASPWSTVRAEGEPGPLGVLLNGRHLGVFRPATVRDVLAVARPTGRLSFAIHSLLGHAPDATADILQSVGLNAGTFWLHDFASLCAGFHLQRNDVVDCAAPSPDSAACGVCAYGAFRSRHTEAHRRLFERLSLTVAAPSQTTLDFWRSRTNLPANATEVVPLARLVSQGLAPKVQDRALRVAFLGMPSPLKGWPIFRELAARFAEDPRYEFLHLGGRPDPAVPAAFHAVVATADRPRAMQQAVKDREVDVALIWPFCRETFSFTAYEAVAGGAVVVTGPDSGNVATFAAGRGRGRVLADATALVDAFETGEIGAMARSRRIVRHYNMVYGDMSLGLVEPLP